MTYSLGSFYIQIIKIWILYHFIFIKSRVDIRESWSVEFAEFQIRSILVALFFRVVEWCHQASVARGNTVSGRCHSSDCGSIGHALCIQVARLRLASQDARFHFFFSMKDITLYSRMTCVRREREAAAIVRSIVSGGYLWDNLCDAAFLAVQSAIKKVASGLSKLVCQ